MNRFARIDRVRPVLLLSCALLFLVPAAGASAFGGLIAVGQGQATGEDMVDVSFRGVAELQTEDHKIRTNIRYAPGKIRDDMVIGDQPMVYISRLDRRTTWIVMPQGMYMEFPLDAPATDKNDMRQQYDLVSREAVGRETVIGEETTKYKVVYDTSDGRYGGFTWFTDDGIAVKSLIAKEGGGKNDRVRFEMTELVRESQPDALFELPKGAQRFDLNALGMMGGMGGAGGPSGTTGAAPAQPTPPPAPAQTTAKPAEDEPNAAEKMGEAARQGAEDTAVEESRKAGSEAVKRAFGGLFK